MSVAQKPGQQQLIMIEGSSRASTFVNAMTPNLDVLEEERGGRNE